MRGLEEEFSRKGVWLCSMSTNLQNAGRSMKSGTKTTNVLNHKLDLNQPPCSSSLQNGRSSMIPDMTKQDNSEDAEWTNHPLHHMLRIKIYKCSSTANSGAYNPRKVKAVNFELHDINISVCSINHHINKSDNS